MSYGPNTDKSGGTRYSEGKPGGWWYAPLAGLRLIAKVWTSGGEKYAPMDWREGQSFSTLFDCMMRHLMDVQEKGIWSRDPDLGSYHLANAAWNLLALLTFMYQERHDLDDITPFVGVTAEEYHCAKVDADILGIPVHEVLRSRKVEEAERDETTHLDPDVVHALNNVDGARLKDDLDDYEPEEDNAFNEGDDLTQERRDDV
jgi:hypothetical protein